MTGCNTSCDARGDGNPGGGGTTATCANVGAGAQSYRNGTSSPFEFRTITSLDGSVSITQDASTIDLSSFIPASATCTNIGAGAQLYDAGSSLPFEFRTLISSDSSVTITQGINTVNLQVPASTATASNIGAGNVDVYRIGTSGPFEFRRIAHMDDLSNLHGRGNIAAFLDTSTQNVRVGLPRAYASSNVQVSTNDTLVSLIDVTFNPDTYGVSGQDGEDWMIWWYLKTCQNPSFPAVLGLHTLQHNNGVWNTIDQHQTDWAPTPPSAPAHGHVLLQNSNWSVNGGLRLRITVRSTNFSVFNTFEQPRLYIQRFNAAP